MHFHLHRAKIFLQSVMMNRIYWFVIRLFSLTVSSLFIIVSCYPFSFFLRFVFLSFCIVNISHFLWCMSNHFSFFLFLLIRMIILLCFFDLCQAKFLCLLFFHKQSILFLFVIFFLLEYVLVLWNMNETNSREKQMGIMFGKETVSWS